MGAQGVVEQDVAAPTGEADPVDTTLAAFEPIGPPRLRRLARNYWWMQIALLLLDALVFPLAVNGRFPPSGGADWLRLGLAISPHLFVAVAMSLALSALYRTAPTIERLWRLDVLSPRGRPTPSSEAAIKRPDRDAVRPRLLAFIEELRAALNPTRFGWRNAQWWLAVGFTVSFAALFFAFFPMGGWTWGFPFRMGHHLTPLLRFVLVVDGAVQVALTVVLALVAQRLVGLALEIIRMARTFDVHPLLQHPDKSGGLAPLGDLCFYMAAIWGVAAIYPTAWLATLFLAPIAREFLLVHLTAYFAILLGFTFTLALATFFVPMYFVHRAMGRARRKMEPHLDALSGRVDELTGRVVQAMEAGDEGLADELNKKLTAVQQAYAASASLPSWPFDAKVLAKFFGTTVIPLTGIAAWLPALVGKVVTGS